jgi:hypothetical protein
MFRGQRYRCAYLTSEAIERLGLPTIGMALEHTGLILRGPRTKIESAWMNVSFSCDIPRDVADQPIESGRQIHCSRARQCEEASDCGQRKHEKAP